MYRQRLSIFMFITLLSSAVGVYVAFAQSDDSLLQRECTTEERSQIDRLLTEFHTELQTTENTSNGIWAT